MSGSFNKVTEAIAESVSALIDVRIENVKRLIEKLEGKQKLSLDGRESEMEKLRSHVTEIEENMKALTGNELATVESLQKEVEDLSQKLLDIEQDTQTLRTKLDKVTGLLKQQTEFRRSMRGVL